jgi:hypothetical protein
MRTRVKIAGLATCVVSVDAIVAGIYLEDGTQPIRTICLVLGCALLAAGIVLMRVVGSGDDK